MTLSELCKAGGYTTDKDTTHSYLESYDEILAPYRNKHVDILEIGNNGGESIKLWDDYFESCNITGLEILDIPQLHELNKTRDNVTIHMNTDAYDLKTFNHFRNKKYDIIIDDGSHLPLHQIFALQYWFLLLKDDGVMVVEDVQDIKYAQPIIDNSGRLMTSRMEIIDLRHKKNRFDDIMIVARRQI